MKNPGSQPTELSASQAFAGVISGKAFRQQQKRKLPPPFSIRFTETERAYLDREAGKQSIATYIRGQLFADAVISPRKNPPSQKPKSPKLDHVALGKVLGVLGQSRLASNLNQIAKAANMGALPVTPQLIKELQQACADIRTMRQMLIKALGLKEDE